MKTILRIGLLTALVIGVTAQLEYNAGTLPALIAFYNPKPEPLQYEPINLEAEVVLKRVRISYDKGVNFRVDAVHSPKSGRGVFGGLKSSEHSKNKEEAEGCFGRPGIKATLKKDAKSFLKSKTSSGSVFCFTAIHFNIIETSEGRAHMRVIVDFHSPKKPETIRVILILLKPAKDAANDNHATTNNVLRIASPIPENELSRLSMGSESFTGDISWMREVLGQAVVSGNTSKNNEHLKSFTKWYFVNPVIIARESFNNILRLDETVLIEDTD